MPETFSLLGLTEHQARYIMLLLMEDKAVQINNIGAAYDAHEYIVELWANMPADERQDLDKRLSKMHAAIGCSEHCEHKKEVDT